MGDKREFENKDDLTNDEFIPYVTAGNLQQKNGAKIIIWGKVTKVSASEGFHVKTVDDQEVLIKTQQPLDEPLDGWYEIHGVSQGRYVLCHKYVPFNDTLTANIDKESHKALSKMLVALDDLWNLGEEANGV